MHTVLGIRAHLGCMNRIAHCLRHGRKGTGEAPLSWPKERIFQFLVQGRCASTFEPLPQTLTLIVLGQGCWKGTLEALRVSTLRESGNLGNCVVDPIGERIVQKLFQIHDKQSRLAINSVLCIIRLDSNKTKNKSWDGVMSNWAAPCTGGD